MTNPDYSYFSSDKPIDELSPEEEKERIKEAAIYDGFSEEDASYMAHMWEKF